MVLNPPEIGSIDFLTRDLFTQVMISIVTFNKLDVNFILLLFTYIFFIFMIF